ncbi:MAG: cytochrome P450, partial [Myxococcales bacterium]|nr:cytochrome P450 [Myxococcales bacterium]
MTTPALASAPRRSPLRPWSALAQATHAAFDPEGFFQARVRRDGDPFRIAVPGLGAVLLTGHPEGAEQLFAAPPATFEAVPRNPVEPLLGPGSMILLDGERHRAERKLVMPALHGDRMRTYGAIIQDAAAEALAGVAVGEVVDVQRLTQAITLQVIVRAIFGVEDAERRRAVHAAVVALLDAYTAPLMLVPGLRRRLAGLSPWAQFERARARFDVLLRDEVAARRQTGGGGGGGEDILSLLLGLRYDDGAAMSDDAVLDELR